MDTADSYKTFSISTDEENANGMNIFSANLDEIADSEKKDKKAKTEYEMQPDTFMSAQSFTLLTQNTPAYSMNPNLILIRLGSLPPGQLTVDAKYISSVKHGSKYTVKYLHGEYKSKKEAMNSGDGEV